MVSSKNIRTSKIRARNLDELDIPLIITSYEPSKIDELKNCYLVVRSGLFEGKKLLCKLYGKRVRKDTEENGERRKKYKYGITTEQGYSLGNSEKISNINLALTEGISLYIYLNIRSSQKFFLTPHRA